MHRENLEFAVVGVVRIGEEDQVVTRLAALLDDFADLRDGGIAAGGGEVAPLAKAVEDVDHDRDVGHGYETSSSRGFGRKRRPTLAHGRPSTITTSAVKSKLPWKKALPTP